MPEIKNLLDHHPHGAELVDALIDAYEPKAADTVKFADNQYAPMATLTVKNVGPIREADIEVKKHTVFIGPQGTGKSTLAKLIAIGEDRGVSESSGYGLKSLIKKYGLNNFISENTNWKFSNSFYDLVYNRGLQLNFSTRGQNKIDEYISLFSEQNIAYKQTLSLEEFRARVKGDNDQPAYQDNAVANSHNFYEQVLPIAVGPYSIFIPTERLLFPLLSNSIWGLLSKDIALPELIKAFGLDFELARTSVHELSIPFLSVIYARENGRDLIYHSSNEAVDLAQSASGYQSIVPLMMVIEYQRQEEEHRFIIEEPELNLYPTAQKDLIYSLVGGLNPEQTYQDAEWVITTHSPYVLTSYNTLMLAYKVAQRSDELRAEVEKIIPARCWINPDNFAAYYVDNGTVRNIMSEQTGMIADNELDDVSEDFAGEQDQLLDLYRSVPSA